MRFEGRHVAVGLLLLTLGACTTLPKMNQPLDSYSPDYGYRFRNLEAGPRNSDGLLVILTFSGGGTRAAAFSYGVLEKLRDTRITWEGQERSLLDEVDVISSVSGGSLPAAYYGLFRERIFDDFPEKVLYQDIQGWLVKQVIALRNLAKLASPFYGRTNLMADHFDHDFFEGKTFSDLLGARRRPFIIINATDASQGVRFDFTQDQFDCLYSDLGKYPVGYGVAASAAFPGILTPVTLKNFPKGPEYKLPAWIPETLEREEPGNFGYDQAEELKRYDDPNRPYVHLVDGGVSDNLGVLPVIIALRQQTVVRTQRFGLPEGTVKKVVIITVNAKRKPDTDWDKRPEILGIFKVLTAASTTPLDSFSTAEVEYLKLFIEKLTEEQRMHEEMTRILHEHGVNIALPPPPMPNVDFHFVEVSFNRVADPEERAALNEVPTRFKLPREDIDRLRAAAGEILDHHPDFQKLVGELR